MAASKQAYTRTYAMQSSSVGLTHARPTIFSVCGLCTQKDGALQYVTKLCMRGNVHKRAEEASIGEELPYQYMLSWMVDFI